MKARATVAAIILAALGFAGSIALASASPLYQHPAKLLIPAPDGIDLGPVRSRSPSPLAAHPKPGLISSWTTNYESPKAEIGVATIGVMVFQTAAQAQTQYAAACHGCDLKSFDAWHFKRGAEPSPSGSGWQIVTLITRCQNLVLGATRSAYNAVDYLTIRLELLLDAMYARAAALGMTSCYRLPQPFPPTGTFYWSEGQAEAAVVRSVKLLECDVFPDDPNCAAGPPVAAQTAICRGIDELGSTFTYSRFECDVTVGDGYAKGRIAVYPTGPDTFRWKLI